VPSRYDRYLGQFRPEASRLYEDDDLPWIIPPPVDYVLGVIGDRFAGKSTVIGHLTERHGFRVWSMGGVTREIAQKRGFAVATRTDQRVFAARLRQEKADAGFLALELMRRIRHSLIADRAAVISPPPVVIAGIKHFEEVEVFKKMDGFRLLVVEADPIIRMQRAIGTNVFDAPELADVEADSRAAEAAALDRFVAEVDDPERTGEASGVDAAFRPDLQKILDENPGARRVSTNSESREQFFAEVDEFLRGYDSTATRVVG
jgi:dephospho-CoA kinase